MTIIVKFLLKYYFRVPEDLRITIGTTIQKGSIFAVVPTNLLWEREPIKSKIHYLLTHRWTPNPEIMKQAAKEVFIENTFGDAPDYGDKILPLLSWHHSQEWKLDKLTTADGEKSNGLNNLSILTRMQFSKLSSEYLNLRLGERAPDICKLLHPMIVKIPVVSIRNYLDIQSDFSFNSIRRSNHPMADDIISYLYEILFIQQKIANSLHEFLRLATYTENQKKDATLIMGEIMAIMGADLVFTYLKASVEKIIVLLGLIYKIKNLESKKTHRSKLTALDDGIPKNVTELPYFKGTYEFLKSENLDELNNYRTGLLHKKGISDLQPHKYVGFSAHTVPLLKIFDVLIEQHGKNTASLIGVLALLTDDLVKRDPIIINPSDIPI